MTRSEARTVLQLYRPGIDDSADPEVAEALRLVSKDSELEAWYQEHHRFQTAMRQSVRNVSVPTDLKDKILAQRKIVPLSPFFPGWLKIAAVVVTLAALSIAWMMFSGARIPDRFADYKSRMVRSALREYRMDVSTNDLAQVRAHMASHGAPADFSIPKRLGKLQLTGGGVLRWRNHPVSMVCYDRGDKQMLFLFIMDRSAVKDPPQNAPEMEKVSKLITASWVEGDKAYVLAGPDEADFAQKYF